MPKVAVVVFSELEANYAEKARVVGQPFGDLTEQNPGHSWGSLKSFACLMTRRRFRQAP